jgi:hypothetical protein
MSILLWASSYSVVDKSAPVRPLQSSRPRERGASLMAKPWGNLGDERAFAKRRFPAALTNRADY